MSNIEFSCDHFRLGTTTIFHLSSEHMTWNKSVEYCRNRGLELASIHSEEEWIKAKESGKTSTCMITLNGKQYGNGNCGPHQFSTCDWFWLGGYLNGTQVVWSDNTTFDWQPHFFELNFDMYLDDLRLAVMEKAVDGMTLRAIGKCRPYAKVLILFILVVFL